jgi:hypothetical protein
MTTPVFISWSGPRSRSIANALKKWLPRVLQAVDPRCSIDTDAGARWSHEIAKSLSECQLGIICVDPDNLHADWILFEAGALAKSLGDDTRVIPYLTDLKMTDVLRSPLSQLQMKIADEEGTLDVVKCLNKQLAEPLPDALLIDSFETFWPKLKAELDAIPTPKRTEPPRTSPTPEELLTEVLAAVREMSKRPWPASEQIVDQLRREFSRRQTLPMDLMKARYHRAEMEERREIAVLELDALERLADPDDRLPAYKRRVQDLTVALHLARQAEAEISGQLMAARSTD